MRKLRVAIEIIILLLTLPCSRSWALIVKLADLQTMAQKSDVVFHGYVGDKEVKTDRLGRIITLTQLEVIDGLYGAKTGQIITIYQVGGELNGVVMPLLGGHVYRMGEEAIVFGLALKDTFVSYGAGQGKLDIITEGGEELVREDLGDVSALGSSAKGALTILPSMPLTYSSTKLLKDEIRLMLKDRS